LTGKIFCGHSNSPITGASATSKDMTIYRYYQCVNSKKKTCAKKRENKEFIESVVVETAMKIFGNKSLMKRIVDTCFELQTTKSAKLPALKNQLRQTKNEIDNVMKAIKAGIFTKTIKSTLERLEQEQETLEIAIANEQIERQIISKEQIKFWINKFSKMDITDKEQKQRLIDVFVNSVYVYDDKMVIVFNYKDDEKCVSYDEVKKAVKGKGGTGECSSILKCRITSLFQFTPM